MNNVNLNNVFERDEYIRALVIIVNADGKVLDKEKEFIERRCEVLDVKITDLWNKQTQLQDLSSLKDISQSAKMSIIYDCITLGYIDNDYESREKKFVFEIAKYLEISESKVNDIERWVKDYKELLNRGLLIMGFQVNE